MHLKFKRILTAGAAIFMSSLLLAAPVAAVAEETAISDSNGDGVIDVFDFVLSKRAVVEKASPVDLALNDAEGVAGGLVTVSVSIGNNPGFSKCSLSLQYDDGIVPVLNSENNEYALVNTETFPELTLESLISKKKHQLVFVTEQSGKITQNGRMFDILFQIPEDAVPGTTYTVGFFDASLLREGENIPVLIERSKITVIEAPASVVTEPPVTTTVTTETTTETTTTETTTTTTTTVTEATTLSATAAPETTTVTTTTVKGTRPVLCEGIDISAWQGDVDFNKIKADPGAQFAILRAGFGRELDQEDRMFRTYYNAAKAVGMPVGAYWYSYADTPEAAKIEANVCAQVLGDRKFEYPIAFDIEEPSVLWKDPAEISAIILAFCSEMEKKGYFVQIYCSSYYLNNRIAKYLTESFDVWVAHYDVEQPTYTGKYGIWQYGLGTCDGIQGDVDVDHCYRDYPTIIKEKHCNGY